MASSSDAIAREDILSTSLQKAKEVYSIKEFRSVTYIGDGIWDFNAARKLGYNFIGIGERLDELKGNGIRYLHKNYLDLEAFLYTLEEIQKDSN